jgi:hypothetical protein
VEVGVKVKQITSQKRGISPISGTQVPRGLRFGEGQKTNAGGAPKTKDIREFLRKWLSEKSKGKENLRRLVEKTFDDSPAVIWHYMWGKPKDTLEITGADGGPVAYEQVPASNLAAMIREREKELATN